MKKALFIGLLSMPFVFSCTNDNKTSDHNNDTVVVEKEVTVVDTSNEVQEAMATLMAKSDSNVSGTVKFSEKNGKVTMKVDVEGLTEGKHAIHIHEFGDCSAPDASSAGGHWNPSKEEHGKWGDHAHHNGDLGNLDANDNGEANYTHETDKWCLDCDDANKNIVGKSVVVHISADDFKTQPSGGAGARVACGEIVM